MRIIVAIAVSICLACIAFAAAGKAQETPKINRTSDGQTSRSSGEGANIFSYGRLDEACEEWTDGCRVCSRAGCSNIGIACQPKEEVTCTCRPESLDNKPMQKCNPHPPIPKGRH